jgi:hypothetical protein
MNTKNVATAAKAMNTSALCRAVGHDFAADDSGQLASERACAPLLLDGIRKWQQRREERRSLEEQKQQELKDFAALELPTRSLMSTSPFY